MKSDSITIVATSDAASTPDVGYKSQGASRMVQELRKLPGYSELIVNFTLREIRAKYKQAFFGIAWAVIQPVVLLAMMTIVFSYLARVPSDGFPYPLFLFTALLPWQFFAGALNRGTNALVNHAGLITKIYFPRECLVLASFGAALVDFAITSTVFVGLLIYYHVTPTLAWLWAIPVLTIQLVLCLGMMLLLAPLNAMYRDIGQAIPLTIQVWMYATPIMYPASLVPVRLRPYYFLNPMAGVIEGYRDSILRNQAPGLNKLAPGLVVAAIILVIGYITFKNLEKRIADVA